MKNLKENYFKKANNLMERLLDEEPTEEVPSENPEEPTEEIPIEGEGEGEEDKEETKVEINKLEIFFNDLDEKSQKKLLDLLKEVLNASEDDEYAKEKIIEKLSRKPIITFVPEEIVRKLNIDI